MALRRLVDDSLQQHPGRDLETALRETVQAGVAIIDCAYAALSVIGPGRRTEYFVPVGVDPTLRSRIGRLPEHRGLLGVIVDDAEIVRLADIRLDPRFIDLPPEHPPVRALLGVPVMLRGRPAGGLYFSQPHGREAFDAADERAAQMIATAAANIIEKARTVAENARRDRWTTGAAELSRVLAAAQHDSPLKLLAETLLDIADADLVAVVQPGPSEDTVVVSAAAGHDAAKWDGRILPSATSPSAQVMRSGEGRRIDHLPDLELPESIQALLEVDAALLVPLTGTTKNRAAIAIARRAERSRFTAGEMGMATMLAGQVGLGLELAELHAQRDRLALVEERDRIARDLHDHVIQRLFAIGLSMQSASMHATGRPAQQLRGSVDDIDDTIKQIRSTIYRLTTPIVSQQTSLRAQAERVLDDLELVLGFRPVISIDGPADFGVDDDIVDDCVAVLREALTNVARHAQATRASVTIKINTSSITLDVRDNGRGIGEISRRSGLSNIRIRAERRDGTLTVHSNGAQGTRLIWSIPNEHAEDSAVRISE